MPEYLTPLPDVWHALDGPHGDNATLYRRTAALAEAANFPDAETFAKKTLVEFMDRCDQQTMLYPRFDIGMAMLGAIAALYSVERFKDLPPDPSQFGYHGDFEALGHLRDILLRHQRKLLDPQRTLNALRQAFVDCLVDITRQLPPLARDDGGEDSTPPMATLALIDLLPNVGAIIESAILHFDTPETEDLCVFDYLKRTLIRNAERLKERTNSKRPIPPSDFKGSSRETVATYLADTGLAAIFLEPRVPFDFPDEQRFSGHWIVAPPGRGKTTLLHSLFLNDLNRPAAIIVMDSKGDLINPLRNLKAVADRLVVIEPDEDHPLALNPLDIPQANVAHTISLLEYVFTALLEAAPTALQSTLFRYLLPAIIQTIPNPTLMTFRDIVENGFAGYAADFSKLKPLDRQFFEKQFNSKQYTDTRHQLIWRLDYLMTNPLMRAMFEAPKTKIDIGKEMDAGKVILINNSKERLSDEGAEFFGRFFVALILSAAQQRSSRRADDKLPCFCYIDECQNVIRSDEKIATILDECRSQKIGMILAHQRTTQITSKNVLSALSNCAIRMANSDDEAKELADKLRTTPEALRSLKRGTFATFVRDLTPSAVMLDVPYNDLSQMEQLSREERDLLRQRMRSQFSFVLQSANASQPATATEQAAPPSMSEDISRPPPVSSLPPDAAQPQEPSPAMKDPGEPADHW